MTALALSLAIALSSLAPSAPAVPSSEAAGPFPPTSSAAFSSPAVRGSATWFCLAGRSRCPRGYSGGMYAAAGPALRAALGRHWRGMRVRVSHGSRSVVVRLVDSCGSARERCTVAIDLFADAFRRLAPLSRGRIQITVRRVTTRSLADARRELEDALR